MATPQSAWCRSCYPHIRIRRALSLHIHSRQPRLPLYSHLTRRHRFFTRAHRRHHRLLRRLASNMAPPRLSSSTQTYRYWRYSTSCCVGMAYIFRHQPLFQPLTSPWPEGSVLDHRSSYISARQWSCYGIYGNSTCHQRHCAEP